MHPQDAINQSEQPFLQSQSKQHLHPNHSTTPQRYAYGQQHHLTTPTNHHKYKGRSLASYRINNQFSPPSLYNSANGGVLKRSKNHHLQQQRGGMAQNRTGSRRLTSTRGSSNGNSQYNSQQQQLITPTSNQNIVSMPGKPVLPIFMPPIGSKESQRQPGQQIENNNRQQNDASPSMQATQIKLGSANSSNNAKSRGNNGINNNMIDSFQNKQKIGSPNTTINNNNIIININKSYNVKNQTDMEEEGAVDDNGENQKREARNQAALQTANISGMLQEDSNSRQKINQNIKQPMKEQQDEQKELKVNSDQKGPQDINQSMLNHSFLRQIQQTGAAAIEKNQADRRERNEIQQFKRPPIQQKVKAGNIFSKRSLSPKNQRTNHFQGNMLQKEKRMSGTTPVSKINHNAHNLVSLPDPSPMPSHHHHYQITHHQNQQQQMHQSLHYQNQNLNDFSLNDGPSYTQPSGYGQRKMTRNGNYYNQRNSPMSYYNNQDSLYQNQRHHQYTPEVRSESPVKYRGQGTNSYYQATTVPHGYISGGGSKIKRKLIVRQLSHINDIAISQNHNGMTIDGVRNDFEKNFAKMRIKKQVLIQ